MFDLCYYATILTSVKNGYEQRLFIHRCRMQRQSRGRRFGRVIALRFTCKVVICTDSQYVKNGMESWIHSWKRNGWQTASKKPVKNEDLWKQLDEQVKRHQVTWTWVKGHSGHPENERADALANLGVEDILNN